MAKNDYTAASIQVLKDLEHIRARPGMYVSDTSHAGLHQLAKEVIDNAVDECLAGHATTIEVELDTKENSLTVSDDGRGIPVEKHAKSGISTLTTVFTQTGAGGKFGSGAYHTSAGLHGVGVKAVNALSSWLSVTTYRDGYAWSQDFDAGKPTDVPAKGKASKKKGTEVSFQPDAQIFKGATFKKKQLVELLEELAYLCPGVTIRFNTAGSDQVEEFKADGGLKQMIEDNVDEKKMIHDPIIIKTDEIEVAMVWTDSAADEEWWTYVNCSYLPEGGTHVTGIKRAITKTIASKTNKSIVNDDVRLGLVVSAHLKVKEPMFKGQSKVKLLNAEIEQKAYDAVYAALDKFALNKTKAVSAILARAASMFKARENFNREKEATRGIVTYSKTKRGILPGKLAEAPMAKPEDRELYILEGDSAAGSAKRARDATYQEILPLRGKIPNASQQAMTTILENEEIQSIITAIGAGVDESCKPKKARVGKILLLMDADPDGQHITSLALSFIYNYLWPLIEEGMVYIVDAPLFKAQYKDKNYYGYTRDEVVEKCPKKGDILITRFKGHGEASEEDLQFYAMGPDTRKLIQVSMSDKTEKRVDEIMGADSSFRKVLLGLSEEG